MQRKLFVLIACEESQTECLAFRALGHYAFSCDVQPCRRGGNPAWHIHGDVSPYLSGVTSFVTQSGESVCVPRWDLIIAHPPCTFLCRMSLVQLHKNPTLYVFFNGRALKVNGERFAAMQKAHDFFYECLNACATYVAVENPTPMALAQLPPPSTYACPSWFGVKYTKKTLYWLRNLPPILPELFHPSPKSFVHCSRGKYRSRTFPAMAEAIAKQWSSYILSQNMF